MAEDVEPVDLDWNKFTLGEMEDLEQAAGVPFAKVDPQAPPIKVLIAAVWIVRRRTNPEFTLADARNTPITALPQGEANGSGRRPTRAGTPARGKR